MDEPDSTSINTNRWHSSDVYDTAVPSPVVASSRSHRSSILQRRSLASERINSALRGLDNVLTGPVSSLPTPSTTPIHYQSRLPLPPSSLSRITTRDTPTLPSPNVTNLSIMSETGLLRDVSLPTPSHTSILFSPDDHHDETDDDPSYHLSRADSPPLKLAQPTYVDHPMLQVGLELMMTFHNHLQEKHSPAHLLDLLEGMEQTCSFQIEHLKTLDNSLHVKDVLIELQLERDTWQLVRALYSDRLVEEEEGEEEMNERELMVRTDQVTIDDYYASNEWIRQGQIVIDWLEQIASYQLGDITSKIGYFTDSGYWESTLHDIQHGLNKGYIVTELDPDAPSRQGSRLSELDEKDELSLCKNLYECVRSGGVEQAQQLCIQCGQSWRAATLEGWKLYHDPNLDKDNNDMLEPVHGNLGRSLWKLSCWELSASSAYNDYEKALYASLSGNINGLLPVCQTWYDYVWAYYKVMVDVLVEQKLLSSRRYPVDDSIKVKLPDNYWKAVLVPEVIFQEIESCPSQRIRRQCVDCYHLSQKHIMLGSLDSLIDEMYSWLQDENNSHLLRFMAHLTLFVQKVATSYDEDKCYDILEAFIKVLISHRLHDLVALYCSYLPHDRHVTAYCHLLANVREPSEQKKCLEIAQECGLDVASITKGYVSGTLEENKGEVLPPSSSDLHMAYDQGITEVDQKKIDVLDWLFYEENHREEALRQCNSLMREFLALNKYKAAAQVFQKIPDDSSAIIHHQWVTKNGDVPLSYQLERDLHEYLSFEAYLKAIESFSLWFQHYHQSRPTTPTGEPGIDNFMEKVAFERQLEKHKSELIQWETELDSLVVDVEHNIYNVLLFVNGGWMMPIVNTEEKEEEESDGQRVEQMKRLRQLCIPKLCFLLHSVLHSSNRFKKCLQIADIIAAEDNCLYKEFNEEELQHFLKLLYSSSLEATDAGLDPLGYAQT